MPRELTPLGREDRRVELRPSAWWLGWFLAAPVFTLAAMALGLSLSNLLHRATPSAWVSVAIAVPLGGWIVWSGLRETSRLVLAHRFPDQVEVAQGRVRLLLRGDAFLRREHWLEAKDLQGTWLDPGQGTTGYVWLQHVAGWSLMLTEDQHLSDARSVSWSLS